MTRIEVATVNEKIANGYNFDFGKYFSDGFEIFKKEWVMFSLYGLVSTFIILFSVITIVGPLFISYPVLLGYSVAAEKVERGEPLELKDFFGAFKNYGDYFLLMLCMIGIIIILVLPLFLFGAMIGFAGESNSEAMGAIGGIFLMLYYFLFYIGIFVLQSAMSFAPYLIHYGGYSAIDSLKTSIKLFRKQPWMILVFVFVMGMLGGVGYIACVIGIFVSMAAARVIQYAMVKDVLMKSSYSEIDQIGKSGI
mgnify:CR=1 FL=1